MGSLLESLSEIAGTVRKAKQQQGNSDKGGVGGGERAKIGLVAL